MSPLPGVVFLGTAEFALPALRALHLSERFRLLAAVSRPPRPAGRGRRMRQPPVAGEAMGLGIPLLQPEKACDAGFLRRLSALDPQVMLCAAYGLYMPKELLETAPHGVVNVHPSMLPRHRGAAPIQRAIMEGDRETALCFMLTDSRGWDTGPVLRCYPRTIGPRESAGSLHDALAEMAGERVEEVLEGYLAGRIVPEPQRGEPTYADKVGRGETVLDWSRPASEVDRTVRALSPWPGARTGFRGSVLKVLECLPAEGDGDPGTIIGLEEGFPLVACGRDAVRLLRVQPQSRGRMPGDDFARGYSPRPGERLEHDG
ncbi:MAG: methionyl-tRNA formyltransferase [Candidatus Fermentibacteraceae bacterium]